MADSNILNDFKPYLSSAEEILEEARQGRMYILVDAEDRENEGDLIVPAQFATPAAVNFMAKHGRGLICLAMTEERAKGLELEPMSRRNQARLGTAFTISIEAREGISTGISAHDRAHTISVAIDPTKRAVDIVSPGHVFPLIARNGGVLVRAGHTEASVDISRLAGLLPAAVICEIMNDDGSMARLPDLIGFSQLHGLKIGTIADLIAYRRHNDHLVEQVVETTVDTKHGEFRLYVFRNKVDGIEHCALVRGAVHADQPTLVRMHRLDFYADVLGARGARADLVDRAIASLAADPHGGVMVLFRDDTIGMTSYGLPIGTEHEPGALRKYGVGAQILRDLGVRRMVLLSDRPQRIAGVEGYGLTIEGWRPLRATTNGG